MMHHTNKQYHRRSIRLNGYDYTQPGAYFVTICTYNRMCLFGEVVDGQMRLNELGRLVESTWQDLPNHVTNIELDAFVVMPNHVHAIIIIVGAGSEPAPTIAMAQPTPTKRYGLPEIVRQFKTFSARRINEHRGTPGAPVWQRNYYEHVIRNEDSLTMIRRYIAENPLRWQLDRENPQALGEDDVWNRLFM
jgi:REP element-mobilizing transposase RayT